MRGDPSPILRHILRVSPRFEVRRDTTPPLRVHNQERIAMSFRLPLAAAIVAATFVATPSRADDKKVVYTGTYTWTMKRNDMEFKSTLKLKQDGEKVTGVLVTKRGDTDNESEIKDAAIKDGVLSFNVTREFNGNSFTIKYAATLAGDTLKLKVTRPGRDGGEPVTTEVEAKKESDKA
jgi:hypothetical protein